MPVDDDPQSFRPGGDVRVKMADAEEAMKKILMQAAVTTIASGGFTITNVPVQPVPPRPDRRFWLVPPHTGITRDMLPEGPKL